MRRPIGEVVSVGFECPSCKTWFHAYWHNDQLEQERQDIEAMAQEAKTNLTRRKVARKRLKNYQKAFDRLQKRMVMGTS